MLTPCYTPHVGGVEKHVKRISEELVRKGNQVSIITRKHSSDLADKEISGGVHLYRISDSGRRGIWSWMWKNRTLIREATIVHCHDYVTFYYWFLPFRLLYFWKPVFVTFHGYEGYPPHPSTIRRRRVCERLSAGNICVGRYLGKWYGTECTAVIWGGVDKPHHEPDMPEKKEEAIAFVGRLERDTGIIEYLKAFNLIKQSGARDVRLYVCGSGSLLGELKKSSASSDGDISFEGGVDNSLAYFQRCRYAFGSGYLAILEAMISKTLVFSTFSNPLKEDYLKLMPDYENIMIVSSSAWELADRFIRMRKNPELQKEIVSEAYRFAEKLTWEKIAEEYLRLYKRKVNNE